MSLTWQTPTLAVGMKVDVWHRRKWWLGVVVTKINTSSIRVAEIAERVTSVRFTHIDMVPAEGK